MFEMMGQAVVMPVIHPSGAQGTLLAEEKGSEGVAEGQTQGRITTCQNECT